MELYPSNFISRDLSSLSRCYPLRKSSMLELESVVNLTSKDPLITTPHHLTFTMASIQFPRVWSWIYQTDRTNLRTTNGKTDNDTNPQIYTKSHYSKSLFPSLYMIIRNSARVSREEKNQRHSMPISEKQMNHRNSNRNGT